MAMGKDSDENFVAHVKAKFREAQASVGRYMKKNPAKAAMIAAGVGAAIGAAATAAILRHRKGKSGEEQQRS
ncbi:hypothetical protein HYU17_00990 [Candidatus Woesearchaeota archaeon]|nr:hypothetical protein [Candidatus Woesearchaeota archaeon]